MALQTMSLRITACVSWVSVSGVVCDVVAVVPTAEATGQDGILVAACCIPAVRDEPQGREDHVGWEDAGDGNEVGDGGVKCNVEGAAS